ncbi:hypothetical protein [Streptomyces sp. NPDC004528]|uniref:hypothetical protein n=1 Tax=Streptomyces sp. NPDC004528 TaxID=3154550 RepID=UPI0033B1F0A0
MEDTYPVVTAGELRAGDVLYSDRETITVAKVVKLFHATVIVTWKAGSDTWNDVYVGSRRVQLIRRGPATDVL